MATPAGAYPKRARATSRRPHLAPMLRGVQKVKYLTIVAIWIALALMFWRWWLMPEHVLEPMRYWAVTFGLFWIWGMQLYFMVIFLAAHRSVAPDPVPGDWRVAMVVTKTPSEPFAVVQKTLEAMLAQDVPHDTWLADENPDAQTRAWCARHGVKISSRFGVEAYHQPVWPRRTRCKEGNLSYFYDHWGYEDYDIVSQLDTDHVPQPGYLREMLRPFADPDVGYVSAPSICSANAKESWAARTRLFAEAAFHGVFQSGYTKILTPMCIGSHYAVRTKALREAGGLGPELAEDHSTTMLIAAAGWRGVHAIDAIAIGDGPASLPDLVTQEFQWSRSLTTLLLRYTPSYLPRLPWRLRFLFVLCQTWYVFFALTMAMLYLVPVLAVTFDLRIANVTYPAFMAYSIPPTLTMVLFAYMIRRDGFFRPLQAKVLAWEKILFVALQWPWVLFGVLMAVYDRLSGKFVDFRITPKGTARTAAFPAKILLLYSALALGALSPVLMRGEVAEARGFYLLALINVVTYVMLLLVAVFHHLRENGISLRAGFSGYTPHFANVLVLTGLTLTALSMRAGPSAQALMYGLEPTQLVKTEYRVAGAGQGQPGDLHIRFVTDFFNRGNAPGGAP